MQSIEIRRQKTTLNGTSSVDILSALALGTSAEVIGIWISNLDNAPITPILTEGGTEVDRVTGIPAGVCEKTYFCSQSNPIHAQGPDALQMSLADAITTTNPVVRVFYRLATDSV